MPWTVVPRAVGSSPGQHLTDNLLSKLITSNLSNEIRDLDASGLAVLFVPLDSCREYLE